MGQEHADLRLAFAWALLDGVPTDRCPAAEQIWDAVRAPTVEPALVDHISACPVCAEAWRLAVLRREQP